MRSAARGPAGGFSLVEVLMATSLLLVIVGGVFGALRSAQGAFAVQPERADMEQRLRAAVDAIAREVAAAGVGQSHGDRPGPLSDVVPPALPFRQGPRSPDSPGRVRSDVITILRLEDSPAQTTLAEPFAARSLSAQVALQPGCPSGDASCGFRRGMDVVVFDGSGSYDTFTVTEVQGATLSLQRNTRDSAKVYGAGSGIAALSSRSFFLKSDTAANAVQLTRYDGAGGGDVPVVNHVVDLGFEYLGDPQPPRIIRPLSDPVGPWTSYGPTPTEADGNCLFEANGTAMPTPRLSVLGEGVRLVSLTADDLGDGPWCPDAADPNRYDADLFRVRSVVVRLRVEAGPASLRGRVGPAPDREVRLEFTPRNLGYVR